MDEAIDKLAQANYNDLKLVAANYNLQEGDSSEPQGRRLPLQRSKRERNARKCGVLSVFHIDILMDV